MPSECSALPGAGQRALFEGLSTRTCWKPPLVRLPVQELPRPSAHCLPEFCVP